MFARLKQIQNAMLNAENIRNISIIAHIDAGKSTITDTMLAASGLMDSKKAGTERKTDTMKMEKERGITIKCTSTSMYFNQPRELLVHLIDSPGHIDFNCEVTAALRVTDGACVVLCCLKGVQVQTKTVLRQAIAERVKPCVFLNKLDRCFGEVNWDGEKAYQQFKTEIEKLDAEVQACEPAPEMGEIKLCPTRGNVGFGAGISAWGFTLKNFAEMYATAFNYTDELKAKAKLMKRLWGNWCWHPGLQKWVHHDPFSGPYKEKDGKETQLERGFVQFIYNPLKSIYELIKARDWERLELIGKGLPYWKYEITELDRELPASELIRNVLHGWLPLERALIDLMSALPSPVEAQAYRMPCIYGGDLDSPIGNSLVKCDANGELSVFITKMLPTKMSGKFLAFGRVFSGTVKPGEVLIMPDGENKAKKGRIRGMCCVIVGAAHSMDYIPAGNIVALSGVDDHIRQTATLTTDPEAQPFKQMKFNMEPVVKFSVSVKPSAVSKLKNALVSVIKTNPMVTAEILDTGEKIIGVAGVLHGQSILDQIQQSLGDVKLKVDQPIVTYREGILSVTGESDCGNKFPDKVLAKSANKHNRFFCSAQPLDPRVIESLDEEELTPAMPGKQLQRALQEKGFDPTINAKRIWAFGGDRARGNIFVDKTSQLDYLQEIKPHVKSAFEMYTFKGVLCHEPLHGLQINLLDAKLHPDAIHRGSGQIYPMVQKVLNAAQIASKPCLYEPIYNVTVTMPMEKYDPVFKCVMARRGKYLEESMNGRCVVIKFALPVAESFDFEEALREATSCEASQSCSFSHWEIVPGDPMEEGSQAYKVVMEIRKRKNLPPNLPEFEKYNDRL